MENSKEIEAGEQPADEKPKPSASSESEAEAESVSDTSEPNSNLAPPSRAPFTSLAQVDADLSLARALQEQERAYMMLRMEGGGDGSFYGSSESGSYVHEDDEMDGHDQPEEGEEVVVEEEQGSDYGEDAFDANDGELNPADFESDEAFARALQDAEDREVAVRLMALTGLNDWGVVEQGERTRGSQDAWQEVDPDELSYEELVALGELVGTENRGLSAHTIASLPSVNYKANNVQDGNSDQCVICRLDYEDDEPLVVLSCKHAYHSECINRWLQINKVCPICSTEVSTSSGDYK